MKIADDMDVKQLRREMTRQLNEPVSESYAWRMREVLVKVCSYGDTDEISADEWVSLSIVANT